MRDHDEAEFKIHDRQCGTDRLNSAAVFISLVFWNWLWGIWGMLLSIPIIVIVKVVSQRAEPLHPMAELLGDLIRFMASAPQRTHRFACG